MARRKDIERKINLAIERVEQEIRDNANHSDSIYSRGLAAEGYAGGYRDALYAVMAVLNDVPPRNDRYYWSPTTPERP